MPLTTAQLATLRTDIANDPTLSSQPMNGDGDFNIAAAYNLTASPQFVVWRTTTPLDDIQDAINWANMTPAASPDGTTLWTNRALSAQGKQFNLQNLLIGRTSIPSGKANIRAALQDALTALPTKNDGTNQPAGWTAVQAVMQRDAKRGERLFAAGAGTALSPGTLVFEGNITPQDVAQARAN